MLCYWLPSTYIITFSFWGIFARGPVFCILKKDNTFSGWTAVRWKIRAYGRQQAPFATMRKAPKYHLLPNKKKLCLFYKDEEVCKPYILLTGPGQPGSCPGRQYVTGIIGNTVTVNSVSHARKNFCQNFRQFRHAPSEISTSMDLHRKASISVLQSCYRPGVAQRFPGS